jgi:hypothetical protein
MNSLANITTGLTLVSLQMHSPKLVCKSLNFMEGLDLFSPSAISSIRNHAMYTPWLNHLCLKSSEERVILGKNFCSIPGEMGGMLVVIKN